MNINEQIEILEAIRDGKRVEYRPHGHMSDWPSLVAGKEHSCNFGVNRYFIVKTGRDRLIDEYVGIMGNLGARSDSQDFCALSGIIDRLIEGKYGKLTDD